MGEEEGGGFCVIYGWFGSFDLLWPRFIILRVYSSIQTRCALELTNCTK